MINYPESRQSDLVVQDFEHEILIYDLKNNKVYCLNETCRLVWQLCDGKSSIADISSEMSRKLKTSVSRELVWLALDELKRDGLLEKSEEFQIDLNGLSRRELIRKAGAASMIALPVIVSVLAPKAASAASVACGPTCVPPAQSFCLCLGMATAIQFNSMDGSCSGGIFNTVNVNCLGGPATSTMDVLVTIT